MSDSKKAEALSILSKLIEVAEGTGKPLPNDGTALQLGQILGLSGLSRDQLRRYPEMKEMLSEYATKQGLAYSRQGRVAAEETAPSDNTQMVPLARLQEVSLRLSAAERKNAELKAENASLRAQLFRADETAELIALGGRIAPGKA